MGAFGRTCNPDAKRRARTDPAADERFSRACLRRSKSAYETRISGAGIIDLHSAIVGVH
jgi:hypothetical protein